MTPSYTLEYALAFGLIFLGLLVVCIPRPRKTEVLSPSEEAKRKKQLQKSKAKNKANAAKQKAAAKKKKKATNARKAKSKSAAKK